MHRVDLRSRQARAAREIEQRKSAYLNLDSSQSCAQCEHYLNSQIRTFYCCKTLQKIAHPHECFRTLPENQTRDACVFWIDKIKIICATTSSSARENKSSTPQSSGWSDGRRDVGSRCRIVGKHRVCDDADVFEPPENAIAATQQTSGTPRAIKSKSECCRLFVRSRKLSSIC